MNCLKLHCAKQIDYVALQVQHADHYPHIVCMLSLQISSVLQMQSDNMGRLYMALEEPVHQRASKLACGASGNISIDTSK